MLVDVPSSGLEASNCSEMSWLSVVSSATACQDNSAKDVTICRT